MPKKQTPKIIKYTIPKSASRALIQFLHEEATLLSFSSDYRRESYEVLTAAMAEFKATRERLLEGDYSPQSQPAKKRDAARPAMMAEMTFCRRIDNYLMYLQDILALIFQKDPAKAGNLTIDATDIASSNTIEDVIKTLRSEALESITQKRRDDLFKAFHKLGFEQVKLQRSRAELNEALQIRDRVVHRRGILGNATKAELAAKGDRNEIWRCGNLIREYESKHGSIEQFISDSVIAVDAEAIRLFSLETVTAPKKRTDIN